MNKFKSNQELEKIIKPLLEGKDLKFLDVRSVNYEPHAYAIGPRHVHMASDHHGGFLGKEVLRKVKCAVRDCQVPYEDHTYDLVVFLQLKKNMETTRVQEILKEIVDACGKGSFSGFTFVETPEKFRIT